MTYRKSQRTRREMRRYEALGWILAAFFTAAFGCLLIATTFACVAMSSLLAVASCYGLFEIAKVLREIDQEIREAERSLSLASSPYGGDRLSH